MTIYLLDENVLRELAPAGHAQVRAWAATAADTDLRISVLTLFETNDRHVVRYNQRR